jgi:diguanylate cyclase (GGDEF)-like protein
MKKSSGDSKSRGANTPRDLELDILRKVGKILASELEIEKILSIIIDSCRELISAEAWSILLIDPKADKLVFSRILGQKTNGLQDIKLEIGQGIAGKVFETKKARIVNDVSKDGDFYAGIDQFTGFKTKSILCIPLASRGKLLGVIEIINKINDLPFTKDDLQKIETYIKFASIALENAKLYEQAVHSSITDDLTGLYNNRYMYNQLAIELKNAGKKRKNLGFIFIDLDKFKSINDVHGHLIGSRTLCEVGKFLKDKLRNITTMIARYGGDEFFIVIPEKTAEETREIAEELRQELSEHIFIINNDIQISITASFGISSFPEQAESIEELIGMADQAMYEVKAKNRNGVKIFSVNN